MTALSRALPQPRLHHPLDGPDDQRPGQPGEHVRLPARDLRPHRLGPLGGRGRRGVPDRPVRRAAAGGRARGPRRPQAADADGERRGRPALRVARRGRVRRGADHPAPHGGRPAHRRRHRHLRRRPRCRPSAPWCPPSSCPPRSARARPASTSGRCWAARSAASCTASRAGCRSRSTPSASRRTGCSPAACAPTFGTPSRRAAAPAAPGRGGGHPLRPQLALLPRPGRVVGAGQPAGERDVLRRPAAAGAGRLRPEGHRPGLHRGRRRRHPRRHRRAVDHRADGDRCARRRASPGASCRSWCRWCCGTTRPWSRRCLAFGLLLNPAGNAGGADLPDRAHPRPPAGPRGVRDVRSCRRR